MLAFTEEDFAAGLGSQQGAAARAARRADRGRLQRHLLLHPRRRPAGGRIPGRRRVLRRRGRLGHPLGRCRPGGGGAAGRRPVRDRPARAATFTGSRRCSWPPSYVSETSQQNFVEIYDILHPLQPQVRRGTCGSARSTPGRRSSARSSWRPAAGSGRTGTRPTPRCSTSCRRNGSRPQREAWAAQFPSPIAAAEALEDAHRRRACTT